MIAYPDLHRDGFPHSEIYGLTVARHLPVAYRSRAASFIASLEPRHPPYALKFLIRKFVYPHTYFGIVALCFKKSVAYR